MDSLMLVILTQPKGMWESILKFLNNAFGSYVWAVIMIAVIVRLLFVVVDVINKRISLKTAKINEKMQPELEAIQKKYGNDKDKLQQKQQEVYKKYQFNMMGSCLPMLIVMILQMAVFFSLWSGLRDVANFNIATQYENTKTVYYNMLTIASDNDIENTIGSWLETEEVPETSAEFDFENNKFTIKIGETTKEYDIQKELSNTEIKEIIEENAKETEEAPLTGVKKFVKTFAQDVTVDYYVKNMEGFLWISNIYKADSATSPVFTHDEVFEYINAYYKDAVKKGDFETQEEADAEYALEDEIFNYVLASFDGKDLRVNGFYILVILAVLSSVLQIFLSNLLTRKQTQTKQTGGKFMYILMPIIFGIFTLMYTSLFAIYIIAGQFVMILLSPLTNFIVAKWTQASDKKAEQKRRQTIDVDYRRIDK